MQGCRGAKKEEGKIPHCGRGRKKSLKRVEKHKEASIIQLNLRNDKTKHK